MCPARDWIHELTHKRRHVAAVAIKKYDDVAFRRDRPHARHAGAPVSARRSYDARASFTRARGCAIGAAVIDHNHFLRQTGRETFAYNAGDWFLFVQSRNNNRNIHRRTSDAVVK